MRNRRDWHQIRSTHAEVLETLERVVAMHPAGSAARKGLPVEREALAPVVELRPRAAVVTAGAWGTDPDDDSDDAA